jgi:class 3 adenylate cyclase
VQDGKVTGIAVNIGARVAAAPGAGEILVSGIVTDLVAGSGFEFEDRGAYQLKGVPGEWKLYTAVHCRSKKRDGEQEVAAFE